MTRSRQDELHRAEQAVFPRVPDDKVWCDIRNVLVKVSDCASNCAAVEHRPVCWLGKMVHDPALEEETDGR